MKTNNSNYSRASLNTKLLKSKPFVEKSQHIQDQILDALELLAVLGIPIDQTPRRLERMTLAFLASSGITPTKTFSEAIDIEQGHSLTTREIIVYLNKHYQEKISSGSYDDIRRKDLEMLVSADIILRSNPEAAQNNPTRKYGLRPVYAKFIRKFGSEDWANWVTNELKGIEPLAEKLARKRDIDKVPVLLPSGEKLNFSPGEHNILQKNIIEEFLPRYGYGAEILYVGDTADKFLHLNQARLEELNFFEIAHGKLPDIIAYSAKKNWLYLIEAVHSSGPISELRLINLNKLLKDCTADLIFVTAFLDRSTFRRFVGEIAWETEVWIAENPDHLIHFNGEKFLGPYKE